MQEADKTLKARMQQMSSAPAGTDHGPYAIEERLHSDKKFNLLTKDGKICIPTSLQTKAAEWYHYHLCHPGETRLELTLLQHCDWKGPKGTVQKVCKGCTICAAAKKKEKKCGKLPPKQAPKSIPWCPHTVQRERQFQLCWMMAQQGGRGLQ